MSGTATVVRWEMRKLRSQVRVWIAATLVVVGPWAFIYMLRAQDRMPVDQLYGRFLKETGFATPLFMLGFGGQWAFVILTAIVAGDIFASEDQQGTLKTILTRSIGRGSIFTGKVLTSVVYTVAMVALLAISSTVAGVVVIGHNPLLLASGQEVTGSHAIGLIAASWSAEMLPVLGFTALAIMSSVLSRNAVIGVVAPVLVSFLMLLYAFLNGRDMIRHSLLTTPFLAWHGFVHDPAFLDPFYRALAVSGVYIVACLAIAWWSFSRRDVTGG